MSGIEKSKFLAGIIIALLVLNFGTLAFMWIHPGNRDGGPGHVGGRNGVFNFLVNELKMTDRQEKEYETLRDEHHNNAIVLQEKGKKLHDDLFRLLRGTTPDSVAINALTDSIAANDKALNLLTVYHFHKVRSICTPEQQKKFDEIIEEAIHMMPGPGRPPKDR